MNDFGQILGNTILSLFLDEDANSELNLGPYNRSDYNYLNKPLEDEGLRIVLHLTPKSSFMTRNCEVLILDLLHSQKAVRQQFETFESILNDDNRNLTENFRFLRKFLISCCAVSPYLNFNSKKQSVALELLRRKFLLNYTVEHKTEHELLKNHVFTELQGTQLYTFNKKLENSSEKLTLSLQIIDNIEPLLVLLRNNELLMAKNSSQKNIRNRFLSEENKDDLLDSKFSFRKKGARYQSSANIKVSYEGRSSINNRDAAEKPFKLMDEVIWNDNIHEDSLEDENGSVATFNDKYELELKQLTNSSSFFTSTNFSFRSKPNEAVETLNFENFGDSATVENLYYILNRTKLAFGACLKNKGGSVSYSSKSNLGRQGNYESNKSLAKKVIISFYN